MPVPPTRPWPFAQFRLTRPQALAPARWLVSHARRAGVTGYPPPRVPSYPSCASPRRSHPERRSQACIAGCGSPVWLASDRALCPPKAATPRANRGCAVERPLARAPSMGQQTPILRRERRLGMVFELPCPHAIASGSKCITPSRLRGDRLGAGTLSRRRELRRIPLPRTPVNWGMKKDRGGEAPVISPPPRCAPFLAALLYQSTYSARRAIAQRVHLA